MSDDERTVLACCDDSFVVSVRCSNREAAFETVKRSHHRCTKICTISDCLFDEMWNDFCIGFTLEDVAIEFFFEFVVVGENSIVDDCNIPTTIGMWVGVCVSRLAVGRPTSVTDAVCCVCVRRDRQPINRPLLFVDGDVVTNEGNPCGVVPTVF
ncbi:hypothetical protein C438_00500 [Haloferax denitrificans ATCC 35960]|uniref:Uncharacterized protein n=1 Tax=Haloferax denitrificans ATCC 35960 TaxID=662478 RepID=M0JKP0_9EURY|nr:hypothetical protein C438_00500 [Haloferax denitrificans ATCC 35960]